MSSRFENDLRDTMQTTRLPVTVGQYIVRLRILNGGPLKSLKFLTDFQAIKGKIENLDKALSTKISYLTAICAVLKSNKKYTKLHKNYVQLSLEMSKPMAEALETNQKDEKQKESIVAAKEIVEIRQGLNLQIEAGGASWSVYCQHLALCLYTMQPPRRNRDFSEMVIVLDEPAILSKELNYFVISEGLFIFNNYKTASTYGAQRLRVSEELSEVLDRYLQEFFRIVKIGEDIPYLICNEEGKKLEIRNAMTRLLHRAIGKNIGSTSLRHIYLSSKYAETLKEQKADAEAMSHSLSMARAYIKID